MTDEKNFMDVLIKLLRIDLAMINNEDKCIPLPLILLSV